MSNNTTVRPPFPLRMPDELRTSLEAEAKKLGRSLNSEIIARLEQSTKLPAMIDSVMGAYKTVDAAHDKKDDLMARMVEVYEAQKTLSDLQQQIIERLLGERDQDQPPPGSPDNPIADPTVLTKKFTFNPKPPVKKAPAPEPAPKKFSFKNPPSKK